MSCFRRAFRSKLWRGTLLLLGAVLITDFIKSLWSGSNRHQNSSVSIPTPTPSDKALFLNDVAFTIRDVWTLLETNNGNYAAVCALDFSKPPNFYDTFALRDIEGHEHLMMTYSYFRSHESRSAMVSHRPVPVQSCWNGMVSFDSSPFYAASPLRFRGIADPLATRHLEGSECCLIHGDNPQSESKGVWLNPGVRVGYDPEAYAAVHTMDPWPSLRDRIICIWRNRVRRWVITVWVKEWLVRNRLNKWTKEDRNRHEPGIYCLINETQVLVHNGWAHV
ncbi:hypothetical protein JMJ35_009830 [Cladonia borealis]|uniref:Uncharacterized protein n=1 Tax=Cladonia borealis TaxID=184061 RepID=A0AA39U518_9LECA|nr:hypothetical protein JMJ35_009830 [Cladonia borealis]